MQTITLAEQGWIPETLIRWGIRRLLRGRLADQSREYGDDVHEGLERWISRMRGGEIAVATDKANEQHYEVPAAFFEHVLGTHLKYSCSLFETADATLDDAEAAMLRKTAERARLADGQRILELGCGWGSLTLWMAEYYPTSQIVAVSNSASQREHILRRARERGLDNVQVITADMNDFDTDLEFDRIVSVEMFEHMRNWEALLNRARMWLADDGLLFVHTFAHRRFAYTFEANGAADWMGRHFFTGGIMPSSDLLARVRSPFHVTGYWWINGNQYALTATEWLRNMDRKRDQLLPILAETYGAEHAQLWFQRWRMFFMACVELFGYRDGEEWGVVHYRLRPAHGVHQ